MELGLGSHFPSARLYLLFYTLTTVVKGVSSVRIRPTPPVPSRVIWGRLLNLSVPPCPHLMEIMRALPSLCCYKKDGMR